MEREKLHNQLKKICQNVYYQPPSLNNLTYPCITYSLSNYDTYFASDDKYILNKEYQLIIISKKPDDPIILRVLKEIKLTKFNYTSIVNNLYQTNISFINL